MVASFPFEAEDGIDHMLEHARSGDGPVLGDMAHQHYGRAALLGETDQLLGGRAHLAHRAGRAFDQVAMHCLDRIDDQQRSRLAARDGRQYVAHRGCRRQLHRRSTKAEPDRAQPHLVDRFLARDIDDLAPRRG